MGISIFAYRRTERHRYRGGVVRERMVRLVIGRGVYSSRPWGYKKKVQVICTTRLAEINPSRETGHFINQVAQCGAIKHMKITE